VASYLNFSVLVDEGDQLGLQPAFVTPAPDQPSSEPSRPLGLDATPTSGGFYDPQVLGSHQILTIEMIAADHTVLSRNHWPLLPLCGDGGSTSTSMASGRISWSDDTALISFYRGSRPIHTERLSAQPPEVRLVWDPPEPLVGPHTVQWEGSHPEGRQLHYLVLYSHTAGRTWESVAPPLDTNELEVNFDDWPGGEAVIAVLASDGVRTARAETRVVRAPPKPLFAIIQSPADGQRIAAGTTVWLQGQAYNRETEAPELEELVWTSSVQGELGRGSQLVVEPMPGQHTITLRAGQAERQGDAVISLAVVRSTR
jgi:hypothetical protein